MFKKIKNFVFIFFLSLAIFSCSSYMQNKQSKSSGIKLVSYSKTLGRAGFLKIVVTKDSLISTKTGSAFNDIPVVKTKIKSEDWDQIVSSINLEMIEKTKSGEGRGYYDGPDEIFEINTSTKNYTLMNVADSTQYQQLVNLKGIIKKITASTK